MRDTCGRADWPPIETSDGFVFPFGISVFFPAYNDARSLPSLLARTFETLRRCAVDYEVIVVNDGSQDDTAEVLDDLVHLYGPTLRVVTHERNRGYGGALRSGFANSSKEFIFYTDGDGQYDPAELAVLLRKVTPETGLVNGYKIARQDPWRRVAIGWMYNHFARFLFAVKLRDIDCDFRLIRKSLLDRIQLSSTSGTICVELVRKIELAAPEIVEAPVHHYPRRHGRSEFFRIQSLATTFLQLGKLFVKLQPAGAGPILIFLAVLCTLAYGRALSLPFISDDYVQIQLAREYGPVSGWPSLAADALYRCRATSLVLTYWTERLFGLGPAAFNVSSLAIHILNCWLVFALGYWRVIGWRISAVAACYFAISQQHQEAVMWYAALPELLVFSFSLLSLLLWVRWLEGSGRFSKLYAGSLICFVFALLSKESAVAVIPLLALAALLRDRGWNRTVSILPFAGLGVLYFAAAFGARNTHLHFNDGTFSLQTPFLLVALRSAGRLFWFWGAISLFALAIWRDRRWRKLVSVAAAWTVVTLLPYSFLTYMPFVPSRHTYFASAGLALIIAAGLIALSERAIGRPWAVWAVATIILLQNCVYLWTRKHDQFVQRAAPTERLIELAGKTDGPVYIRCFPYEKAVAELAVDLRIENHPRPVLVSGPYDGNRPDVLDLCVTR